MLLVCMIYIFTNLLKNMINTFCSTMLETLFCLCWILITNMTMQAAETNNVDSPEQNQCSVYLMSDLIIQYKLKLNTNCKLWAMYMYVQVTFVLAVQSQPFLSLVSCSSCCLRLSGAENGNYPKRHCQGQNISIKLE